MKVILAVDGNSILNRAFYGIRPLTTKDGLNTNAVYGFVNILKKTIDKVNPDGFAVAFDLKAKTFRHNMFDGYKAGRKGMPDELAEQLPYAKKCAEAMGAKVITLEGFEADDILGTISNFGSESDVFTYILTGDRDSLQLINKKTTVLLATNNDTINFDREKFIENYGITPDVFVDVKALMGDSSDNIPGVAGIGEKTALKLISDFGNLDGVYNNIDSPIIKPGQKTKLSDGKEMAYLSKTLATIVKDAPINENSESILGYKERAAANESELLDLFTKLEFSALIKRFNLTENGNSSKEESADGNCKINKKLTICSYKKAIDAVDAALEISREKVSIIFGDELMFSTDKSHIFTCPNEDIVGILLKLQKDGTKLCVYDSKSIYHKYNLEDKILFDYDVMLAAYVVNPTESSFDLSRLKLSYLGESSGECNSAELFELSDILEKIIDERGQKSLLHDIEIPLAAVLAKMEKRGFKIDVKGLCEFSNYLLENANMLEERIYLLAGCKFNIKSPKQLSDVLFEKLMLPHGKRSKSGYYSTSVDILEKLAPYHAIVADILEYRQLTKLQSTYGEGLVKAADENGLIHTSFNQALTATGRLSSTEPNLQNIPIRTELGSQMRKYFIPNGDNRVLIDADYSQIELRLLAHISGDENMIEAFNSGIDIHTVTASQVFRVPIEAVTSEMRKRAKAVNFGIVYGISDFSLAMDIGVTKRQAGEYIETYLARYPKVAEYLKNIILKAESDGYVSSMLGRRRYIPELSSQKKVLKAFGERVAMNAPIQASAADIIKIAMCRVDKALEKSGLDAKLILQVHDELIVDCNADDADKVKEILISEMENCIDLSVELIVEAAMGVSWLEAKA